jgi:hypothetical protein
MQSVPNAEGYANFLVLENYPSFCFLFIWPSPFSPATLVNVSFVGTLVVFSMSTDTLESTAIACIFLQMLIVLILATRVATAATIQHTKMSIR